MKYTGTFEELKELLKSVVNETWDETQPNKKVVKQGRGILNWHPTTGSFLFQGKEPDKSNFAKKVIGILDPSATLENKAPPVLDVVSGAKAEPHATFSAAKYLRNDFGESELIFGVVSAVGTDTERVIRSLKDRLKLFRYDVVEIKVSSLLSSSATTKETEYERIRRLMGCGDHLRKETNDNSILALGVTKKIAEQRGAATGRKAYIVNSLKHPDEVDFLRKIYGQGFYLLGIHADSKRRNKYLSEDKGLTPTQAEELIDIDEDENVTYGQRTRDTFHKADFFINLGSNDDQVKHSLDRFLELIFAHPYKTPTFDEFAMFMAFSSSVRSGDLSRQVGAVLAKNSQIIAMGANDCPQFGGGLYWAKMDKSGEITDAPSGKDFTRGQDSNKAEQKNIIDDIAGKISKVDGLEKKHLSKITEILSDSRIGDLTEFGRVVHAEMETLLSCARSGIDASGAVLYCTTFPCHNCAKHIIAAGVSRVVYVEPYPKSKALDFHEDSIFLKEELESEVPENFVAFEPFTGVGARRFLDLFSMSLGDGSKLRRKDKEGNVLEWDRNKANLRVTLLPCSYRDLEKEATKCFDEALKTVHEKKPHDHSV